jgi:hypothetical protein
MLPGLLLRASNLGLSIIGCYVMVLGLAQYFVWFFCWGGGGLHLRIITCLNWFHMQSVPTV